MGKNPKILRGSLFNQFLNIVKMKRRNFIQNAAAGVVLPSFFGSGDHVGTSPDSPLMRVLLGAATDTNHVLVILRMAGGNDGLNMVIPLDQYANLSTARANILINENQVLKLGGANPTNATGLHPAMTGLKELYDENKLKIVQAAGYPTPSFSHFRATDIWMSASDYNKDVPTGWVGRYMMSEYPNYPEAFPNTTMPDPLAIQVGDMTLGLMGLTGPMGVSYPDLANPYSYVDNGEPALTGYMGKELDYIRIVARQSDKYGAAIAAANTKGSNSTAIYPDVTKNALAKQLQSIARLIKGGLKTRVYLVNVNGSFDTHSTQVDSADHAIGNHANLLKQMSEAITAFQRDCEGLKIDNRVIGMTFSEFGRRIKSNGSAGTDHGAALPMFVWGTSIFGGILGTNPTISASTDVNSNVPMQYDFRSVYSSILEDWFCVNPTDLNKVMLKNFQKLRIVNSASCITPTSDINQAAGLNLISNYPNPFSFATTIEFETQGGHTMVQIFDVEGRLVATPVDASYVEGKYKVYYNGGHLVAGVYYARLQNGSLQQVRTMLKVQ